MKKQLALLILLLVNGFFGRAQSLPRLDPAPHPRPIPRMGVLHVEHREPLLLIGAQETKLSALVVQRQDLVILHMYQDSALLANMGEKGRNGVVVAELKSKRPLFRLEHVLDYFNIPDQKRALKVLVNNQPVNAALFLADVQQIEKIEVITQDATHLVRYSFDEQEEYLNIVTVKSLEATRTQAR